MGCTSAKPTYQSAGPSSNANNKNNTSILASRYVIKSNSSALIPAGPNSAISASVLKKPAETSIVAASREPVIINSTRVKPANISQIKSQVHVVNPDEKPNPAKSSGRMARFETIEINLPQKRQTTDRDSRQVQELNTVGPLSSKPFESLEGELNYRLDPAILQPTPKVYEFDYQHFLKPVFIPGEAKVV